MAGSNGQHLFHVALSGAMADTFRRLEEVSDAIGLGDDFLAALKAVNTRLRTNPHGWGDPKFGYHAAGMVHRSGWYWMLIVEYAVHPASRTVFVQNVRPFPGTPLADAAGES